MVRRAQLAVVLIALVFVLSAAGYGIVRGVTAKDYSAYNQCVADYYKMLQRRRGVTHAIEPGAYCRSYRPD